MVAPSGALPAPTAHCPRHPVFDPICLDCREYYREQIEWEQRQRDEEVPPGAPRIGVQVHPDQESSWSGQFDSETAPRVHPAPEQPDECTPSAPEVHREYGFFDVAAMLDGTMPEPPTPSLCYRDDGIALFYEGQLNVLFGDPECGKTLLTDHATAEALRGGGSVLRLDLDHNGPQSTINRLITFGAPVDALRDPTRFLYVEPEDRAHMDYIVKRMETWRPTLVILDSLGELLPMFGSNSNSADEFTACHSRVIKPLVQGGAAVVAIDHLSKGADSRAYGPGGTMAKKRVLGGSSIRVKVDVPFTPGKGGSAYLALNKDRHGGLRKNCPVGDREPLVGKFVLHPTAEGVTATIKAAKEFEKNPEEAAPAEDLAALAELDPAPKSARDVKARMHWGDARSRTAFRSWEEQRGTQGSRTPS
ncbi:AAA family ATPase [Nocardia niigatensis]